MKRKNLGPILMMLMLGVGLVASLRLVNGPLKTANYAAGPACVRTLSWKCALTQHNVSVLEQYPLRYRLAVYTQSNELKASTNINDTRDQKTDEVTITFSGEAEEIFTCALEVFDEGGIAGKICARISGRIRCEEIAPTPDTGNEEPIPTPVEITSDTCLYDNGDVNQDGNVDLGDVNVFVSTSMGGGSDDSISHNDLNCDRQVNAADWKILFQRLLGTP